MESHQQIEDEAASWLVRRDADGWTDSDQVELTRWLQTSAAHVVAFLRLEAAWRRTDRLKSLGAGIARGAMPSPDDWQLGPAFERSSARSEAPASSRRFLQFGLAACVCAAVLISVAAYQGYFQRALTFRTLIGGIATVPVEDGSRITLNTGSEVRVAVTRSERHVRLDQGEAYFEVAKDSDRPFIVSAGGHRVVAVGTAFSVRRDATGVRVAVTDGRVRIEPDVPGSAASTTEFADAGSLALIRGDRIEVQQRPLSEVEETLSWRSGYLVFHDVPLPQAVDEFNRYNVRKIQVADPRLGEIRLSGKFQATQYQAFIRLLEDGFAIHAENYEDRIVLTTR